MVSGPGVPGCAMAISAEAPEALAAKFAVMRQHLGERQWRLYLGSEERVLGTGDRGSGPGTAGAASGTDGRDLRSPQASSSCGIRIPTAGRPPLSLQVRACLETQ